jgi:FkbM family methyltransferase
MLSKIYPTIRSVPWLGRLMLSAIPDLRWHVAVEPIGKVAIQLRRNRSYWLRPPLMHEGFMLGALARLVRPGDVVYDIGANIGLYSRFLVQEFGAGRVYAFEPMSENLPLLEENLRIGRCSSQVTVLPFAVGNEDGTAAFEVDVISSATGALAVVTGGQGSHAHRQYHVPAAVESVEVRRLDTLIREKNLAPPNVIKIDIEGAEAMAIEGASQVLREHAPLLVIELHGAAVATKVLQLLWQKDYHCYGYLNTETSRTYKEIVAGDLGAITDKYSVHFLVASRRAADVSTPVDTAKWNGTH